MHYILSSSAAPQWAYCAGSVMMQAPYPNDDTPEAREGTASHWAAEQSLHSYRNGTGEIKSPRDFIGHAAPNGVMVDKDMADGANVLVMDVLKVAQQYGSLRDILIEQRVTAPQIHPLQGGTLDVCIPVFSHNKMYIYDYKYGHLAVDAFENQQAICYYAGLYNKFGLDGEKDQFIDVHIRIVQPRAYHRHGAVREWVAKGSDLRAYVNKLTTQGEKALQDNAETVSGKHCLHCLARHDCATATEAAQRAIVATGNSERNNMRPEDVAQQLRVFRAASIALKASLTGIEQYAETLIEKGEHVPGYAVERGQGRTRWRVPPEQVVSLGKAFNIMLGQLDVMTPLQAKAAGMDENIIKDYTETPQGSPKVVEAETTRAYLAFNRR